AGHSADPTAGSHLDELFPHGHLDIRRHRGRHAGLMQHLAQAFDPRTATIVQLPHEQVGIDTPPVLNMARGHAHTHYSTTPAHARLRPAPSHISPHRPCTKNSNAHVTPPRVTWPTRIAIDYSTGASHEGDWETAPEATPASSRAETRLTGCEFC